MNESSKATEAASYAVMYSETWNWNESQLAELNRHLDKPFGEVERFNQALAFVLWKSGHPLEYWCGGSDWVAADSPQWGNRSRYRVLPKPEPLVLPSIDWSHVAPKWKWLTQDQNGKAYLFDAEPRQGDIGWGRRGHNFDGDIAHPELLASLKPGKGDWKKLIVERPQ